MLTRIGDRIVNGENAESHIPWQVHVRHTVPSGPNTFAYRSFCGGTILDETTILSAAHCFYALEEDMQKYDIPKKFKGKNFINAMDATIRVGFTDQSNPGPTFQVTLN